MAKNTDSLLEITVAAIAITTTIFLLHKFLSLGFQNNQSQPGNESNGQGHNQQPDCYNNTGMPGCGIGNTQIARKFVRPEIQRVEVVEYDRCLVPDGYVTTYPDAFNGGQTNWGELNPDSPDFSENRNF